MMENQEAILESVDGTEFAFTVIESIPGGSMECSNCRNKFGPGFELTKYFHCQNEDNGTNSISEVCVIEAMNYILRWRSFGITFQRHGGQTLLFEECETGMCSRCVDALAKLYNSIRTFDGLTNRDSKVNQLTTIFLDTISELASKSSYASAPEQERTSLPPQQPSEAVTKSTKFVPYNFESGIGNLAETKYTWEDVNVDQDPSELLDQNLEIDVIPVEITPRSRKRKKEESISYICEPCGATFNKSANLRRHLLLSHGIGDRDKAFKCDKCDRSFHFQYMLRNHEKVHKDERMEQCSKCLMRFKGKDGLSHHIKDVHKESGSSKPACQLCKKTFRQERSLQEHMLVIHRQGKKDAFQCPNCVSQFKRNRSMLAHLRNGQCNTRRKRKLEESKRKLEESKRKLEESKKKLLESKQKIIESNIEKRKCLLSRRETSNDPYPCPFHCGQTFCRKSSMLSHISHLCQLKPKMKFEFEDEEEYDFNF